MVYVTGDTHRDFERFRSADAKRLKKHDILVVLGDFGFVWDGSSEEEKVLTKISKLKFTVAFLDGPHENFDLLEQYPTIDWNGGKARLVKKNLIYLPRGEFYTIGAETYFVFGGGQSENYELYAGGKNKLEKSLPTTDEMKYGADNLDKNEYKVDFIFTHEPSFGSGGRDNETFLPTGMNTYLSQVEKNVDYKKWFFGYLHQDKVVSKRHCSVYQKIISVGSPVAPPKKVKREKKVKTTSLRDEKKPEKPKTKSKKT